MKGFSGGESKKLSGGRFLLCSSVYRRFLLFLLTCAGVLHQEWSLPHKLEEEEMIIWHLDALKFQQVATKHLRRFYPLLRI